MANTSVKVKMVLPRPLLGVYFLQSAASLQVYICLVKQHMLGSLTGVHSAFGVPDAFGLELAHLTPELVLALRFACCIYSEPYRVPGDRVRSLVLYLSFSARMAEALPLPPTKPISVPAFSRYVWLRQPAKPNSIFPFQVLS